MHACMHAAERLLFHKNLSNGHSAKVYTLKMYPLYGIYGLEAQFFTCTTLFDYAHAMDVQSSTSGVRGSSCELRSVYASLFCM